MSYKSALVISLLLTACRGGSDGKAPIQARPPAEAAPASTPTSEPPASEPPASEPPASEPPASEPPAEQMSVAECEGLRISVMPTKVTLPAGDDAVFDILVERLFDPEDEVTLYLQTDGSSWMVAEFGLGRIDGRELSTGVSLTDGMGEMSTTLVVRSRIRDAGESWKLILRGQTNASTDMCEVPIEIEVAR